MNSPTMPVLTFENDTGASSKETPVQEFTCTCNECGSADVTLNYTFRYYGAATGYDQDITIYCRNCSNRWSASI